LQTGYDVKQHYYGELVTNHVIPAVHQLYEEMHKQVFTEVKEVCAQKKIGATITSDGGYSSRNNNSDHAVVDFIEHVTGKQMILHLEMIKCSSQLSPQSAEKELTVSRVGHDGKEIKDMCEIIPGVADDLDPWHFKKLEMSHFTEYCTGDSTEIKEMKMRRRHHLLKIKDGLGFHLIRSCKWSKQSKSVATMLWSSYVLHYLGCHTFCFDDQVGIESSNL